MAIVRPPDPKRSFISLTRRCGPPARPRHAVFLRPPPRVFSGAETGRCVERAADSAAPPGPRGRPGPPPACRCLAVHHASRIARGRGPWRRRNLGSSFRRAAPALSGRCWHRRRAPQRSRACKWSSVVASRTTPRRSPYPLGCVEPVPGCGGEATASSSTAAYEGTRRLATCRKRCGTRAWNRTSAGALRRWPPPIDRPVDRARASAESSAKSNALSRPNFRNLRAHAASILAITWWSTLQVRR